MAFKVYEGDLGERLYNAESDIYRRLLDARSNSITKCYGCFSYEETKRRIIILEFAKEGSLLDFLQKTSHPTTPQESKQLWQRLLNLLDGLHILHNLGTGLRAYDWPITA